MLHTDRTTPTHITLRTDEPARFEIKTDPDGHLVIYGYTGIADDLDQEPTLIYVSRHA